MFSFRVARSNLELAGVLLMCSPRGRSLNLY